jgi:CBS domain-containing protein
VRRNGSHDQIVLPDLIELPETEWIMTETSAPGPSSQPPEAWVTVADVMQPALTTVEPDAHLAAAAYLMHHAGTTALVVVDDEDTPQPLGLITEADVVQAVADGKDVNTVRIHDLMTERPTVITATASIRDAARAMIAGHFRHLPVVDDTGLIGMVDIRDVCSALLGPPAG